MMIEEVGNSKTIQPHFEAHKNYISGADYLSCTHIVNMPYPDMCLYVLNTPVCRENEYIMQYSKFFFCSFNTPDFWNLGIILMIFIAILYSVLVIELTYVCLAPNLLTLSEFLKLSEHGAAIGVHILFAGIPNILMLHTKQFVRHDSLIVNQLESATLLLRCFCAGILIIRNPITLYPQFFIRDELFYFFGVIMVIGTTFSTNSHYSYGLITLLLYIIQLIFVYYHEKVIIGRKSRNTATNSNDVESSKHGQNIYGIRYIAPLEKFSFIRRHEEELTLFTQFLADIHPKKICCVYTEIFWQNIVQIMGIPFYWILALLVPVVNHRMPLQGWSKILNIVNLLISPYLICIIYNASTLQKFLICTPAIIFALYTAIYTTFNESPKFHTIFALIGILITVPLIHITTSELVSILNVLGYCLLYDHGAIRSLLLALGNCIQHILIGITMVSWGYPMMGIIGLFFSPMITFVFNYGLMFFLKNLEIMQSEHPAFREGVFGINCLMFIFAEVCLTFFAVSIAQFKLRRSVGYYLVLLYAVYMVFDVLTENETIHGYSTDHVDEALYPREKNFWA